MYLDEASVTGHGDGAAGRGARPASPRSVTPPPSRTSSSSASSSQDGRRHRPASAARAARRGVARSCGAAHRLGGDYIEAGSWAVVAAITGGEIAIEGARDEDIEVVAAVLKRMNVDCGMRDGVFEVKPSKPQAVRRITTGTVAGVSERPGQPGHGAGDAGGGAHAGSRLDVRAAPVRARADERHGRRSVPGRRAPHHRDRPDATARRPRARQPRSALGHVADRRRRWRPRADARRAARDRRARLRSVVERLQALGARVASRSATSGQATTAHSDMRRRLRSRSGASAAESGGGESVAGARVAGRGAAADGGRRRRRTPAGRDGIGMSWILRAARRAAAKRQLVSRRRSVAPTGRSDRLRRGRARGRSAASASGRCRSPASPRALCANSRPMIGRSLSPGMPRSTSARRRGSGRPACSSRRRAGG